MRTLIGVAAILLVIPAASGKQAPATSDQGGATQLKQSAAAQNGSAVSGPTSTPFAPATILRNMPTNSDSRCTGISLVAEALLAGELLQEAGCDAPEELGKQIYESAITGRPVRFHKNVCVEGAAQPIESRAALDCLSTVVTDHFKQQFTRLMATEGGQKKLLAAQRTFIGRSQDLNRILDSDPDKFVTFFLVGTRTFADGTMKDTAHAVLICKTTDDRVVIYDPNDPGEAIACRLEDTNDGLLIEWTCRFRDTGQVTTQNYFLIEKATFFRMAFQAR